MKTKGIFINSDAWNFWHTDKHELGEQDIRDDVDFYVAGGGVEALLYNMNFQRTFFPSKTWTPYWKDITLADDGEILVRGKPIPSLPGQTVHKADAYRDMFLSVMSMLRNCPDYMRVRYAYCHEKGIEMWHSMRTNDVHWTSPGLEDRPQHGDFWYYNKEAVTRAWYRRPWFKEWNWYNYALDYGRQDVFDYNVALAREYLLDYESDGLEIDWLRCIPVFRPGCDDEGTPILTAFMREVRRAAREAEAKWGHRVRVATRCPARVQDALDVGMDIPAWAEEGLVDIVVPGPQSVRTEQDCQVALWKRLLPDETILAPTVDMYVASGWMARGDLATDAAFAANYYHQGADTIYVYNHFPQFQRQDSPEQRYKDMQAFFPMAANRAQCDAATRRHVVTWRETAVEGARAECSFPASIAPGSAGAVRLNMGGATDNRSATLIIGLTDKAMPEVWLNGVCCGIPSAAPPPEIRIPQASDNPVSYAALEIPDGTIRDGWNVIDLHNVADTALRDADFVWLEIRLA